jgi:DNA-binding protein HU-beta
MNKQQLIDKIAEERNLTKTKTEAILNTFFDTIKKSVKKGDDVKIVGFGTFTKTKHKARTGRNPQNGTQIKIPAGWYPKFRSGTEFRKSLK